MRFGSVFLLISMAVGALGAEPERPAGAPGLPRPGSPGPWDRDVLVYHATSNGLVRRVATFERAGVPTIARLRDGRIIAAHQHFPENDAANFDKVAIRFSSDEAKTWSAPEVIRVKGFPEEMRFPFDPTLLPLPDGRVRLYFTSLRKGRESVPAIHSAISSNGVDYVFEPGMRFGVEGRMVIDCAAVLHKGIFHLFAPDNGPQRHFGEAHERPPPGVGYHAISTNGLDFKRVDNVQIEGRRHWLGNAQSDGKVITFYGTGDPAPVAPGQPRSSVWISSSADGQTWTLEKGPAVMGGDPGAVRTKDSGLLIVITGEPRPGTPSANRRPQP
jgi:hypothetical protein